MILHAPEQEKSEINHMEERVALLTQILPVTSQLITKILHFAGFPIPSTMGAFSSHRVRVGISPQFVLAAVTLFLFLPLTYRSS